MGEDRLSASEVLGKDWPAQPPSVRPSVPFILWCFLWAAVTYAALRQGPWRADEVLARPWGSRSLRWDRQALPLQMDGGCRGFQGAEGALIPGWGWSEKAAWSWGHTGGDLKGHGEEPPEVGEGVCSRGSSCARAWDRRGEPQAVLGSSWL